MISVLFRLIKVNEPEWFEASGLIELWVDHTRGNIQRVPVRSPLHRCCPPVYELPSFDIKKALLIKCHG
jgi:hypothetical protein